MNFIIDSNTVKIDWLSGGSCDNLEIPSSVSRGPFTIRRKNPLDCPLPEDKPGQFSGAKIYTSAVFTSLPLHYYYYLFLAVTLQVLMTGRHNSWN